MSNKRLTLEVVTPERLVYSCETTLVEAPGVLGEFGVMADHAPLVSALDIGKLMVACDREGEYEEIFISGGFFEVSNNKAVILSRAAELKREIDRGRAEKAKARAEERLAHPSDELDVVRAEMALRRALARLKMIS